MRLTTEERARYAEQCRAAGLFELAAKLAPRKRGRPCEDRNADNLTRHQQKMRELRDEMLARIDDGEDPADVAALFESDRRVIGRPAETRFDFLLNLLSNRSDLPPFRFPKKIRPNYPT